VLEPVVPAVTIPLARSIAGVVPPLDVILPVVPLTLVTLLLKVDQSVELKAPRFVAEAVGTFKVMTGVVVGLATVDDKSVPVVPSVKADTFVTVPVYWSLLVIVKLG